MCYRENYPENMPDCPWIKKDSLLCPRMVPSWDDVLKMAAFVAAALAEAKTIITVTLVFAHPNEDFDHSDFFGEIAF